MKNTVKKAKLTKLALFLAMFALVAAIGFTFVACDDGGGGGGPETVTYTGTKGGDNYRLEITQNTGRYTAQTGDSYRLIYVTSNKYSTGTITVSSSGGTITLTARNGSGTVTVTVTESGIVSISGNGFTWDNSGAFTAPGTLTPTGSTGTGAPGTGTPGGGGGGSLNGTWVTDLEVDMYGIVGILEVRYNNGNSEATIDGMPLGRSTYTTTANTITDTPTQIHGALFIRMFENAGLDTSILGLQSKWYTKEEFKAAYMGGMMGNALDDMFAPSTVTYSISGNRLTLTSSTGGTTTYTRK